MWTKCIKPISDCILALIFLMLFSPIFVIIFCLVAVFVGQPAIFKQPRAGYRDKIFNVYKFRSMTNQRNAKGELLPDAERLTVFGKFLRASSLDELPQLWNVLKGDMSFVGPRPLLVEYLPLYNEEQKRRHLVRPGITGWAQVNGRNAISWEEKFKLDCWYVDHQSFKLEMKIFWLTLLRILKRDGINQSGNVTMAPFRGSH